MNNNIRHSGIVETVSTDGHVCVRIVQTSACAACKVAGYCNASEAKEKLVDVYHANVAGLNVGDTVVVTASQQVAARALLLGFGLPFVLLVSALLIVWRVTGDEMMAALSGLLALVPYYAVLYVLRNRIRQRLAFSIER